MISYQYCMMSVGGEPGVEERAFQSAHFPVRLVWRSYYKLANFMLKRKLEFRNEYLEFTPLARYGFNKSMCFIF